MPFIPRAASEKSVSESLQREKYPAFWTGLGSDSLEGEMKKGVPGGEETCQGTTATIQAKENEK